MDIRQALTFIKDKGSRLEKARMVCILHQTTPPPEVVQDFILLQNEDGGFPFGMQKGNLSTINETTVALWWLEELNLLSSSTAANAFSYLLKSQRVDGSWDEDPQVEQYNVPAWIQIGDLKTKLYLSAYATYWLMAGGYARHPAVRKAFHFLIRNQKGSGKFHGYLHTTWIAVGAFLMAGERYAQIATHGLEALSDRTLAGWDDSHIAWALDCLSRGGLPKSHPFIESCTGELMRRQGVDGSWASADGETFAVSATIQAVKVLNRYGLVDEEIVEGMTGLERNV